MKIITLTLSPAIDIEYQVATVRADTTSRAKKHNVTAGGKGINVSRALIGCGIAKGDLLTVAPLGGFTGEMMKNILIGEGILVTGVNISENTRINTSVIGEDDHSVEVNAPGTPVLEKLADIEGLILDSIDPGDVLVIAGSCPSDVKKSYPSELCQKAKNKGAVVVLDCDGEALKLAVASDCPPDLIKPNKEELGGLLDRQLETDDDVKAAAESLTGITVITTMAGDGAFYTSSGESKFYPSEKRPVVRLKGAGDTFLGAFVYAKFYSGKSVDESMAYAAKVAGDYVAGL